MQAQTKSGLWPMVNGSFNHELTNEEMLEFSFEDKKRMAWSLIVSMQFAHSFRDVDQRVFTEDPPMYTHDMITEDKIDDILVNARTDFQQKHKKLLALTHDFYYRQGQEIFKAQRELGFGGFIQMDYRKLMGYIQAGGSWNEFNASAVSKAISELEAVSPKFYIKNNPNNGSKRHAWTTNGAYVTMHCDYIPNNNVEEYMSFYKNHFQRYGRIINADSVRYVLQELDHGASSLEFIYWWD